jgi:hypothetical protein
MASCSENMRCHAVFNTGVQDVMGGLGQGRMPISSRGNDGSHGVATVVNGMGLGSWCGGCLPIGSPAADMLAIASHSAARTSSPRGPVYMRGVAAIAGAWGRGRERMGWEGSIRPWVSEKPSIRVTCIRT